MSDDNKLAPLHVTIPETRNEDADKVQFMLRLAGLDPIRSLRNKMIHSLITDWMQFGNDEGLLRGFRNMAILNPHLTTAFTDQ